MYPIHYLKSNKKTVIQKGEKSVLKVYPFQIEEKQWNQGPKVKKFSSFFLSLQVFSLYFLSVFTPLCKVLSLRS